MFVNMWLFSYNMYRIDGKKFANVYFVYMMKRWFLITNEIFRRNIGMYFEESPRLFAKIVKFIPMMNNRYCGTMIIRMLKLILNEINRQIIKNLKVDIASFSSALKISELLSLIYGLMEKMSENYCFILMDPYSLFLIAFWKIFKCSEFYDFFKPNSSHLN